MSLHPVAVAAMVSFTLVAGSLAHAAPVSVSQTVAFADINAFNIFSEQDATVGGWSSPWPFTQASQINSVTLTFSSTDPNFSDPNFFPVESGGGIPGVEVGFLQQGTATRSAIASVTAAAPTINLTDSAGAVYTALLAALLDGSTTFSLGGFVNYANPGELGLAFSIPTGFGDGSLLVTVNGTLPDTPVPEPGTLALAALALMAATGAARRTRRGCA